MTSQTRTTFLALIAALLSIVALANAVGNAPRVDPLWDALMGAGYCALALMAWLPLLSARHAQNLGLNNGVMRGFGGIHKAFAWIATVLILVHIIGLILIDSVNIEYLKPGAPAGMLAAIAASLIFIFLMLSSLKRFSWYPQQSLWRFDHGVLSLTALALCGWHALDAHYYPRSKALAIPLLVLIFAPTILSLLFDARLRILMRLNPNRQSTQRVGRQELKTATNRLILIVLILFAVAILLFTLPWPVPGTDA